MLGPWPLVVRGRDHRAAVSIVEDSWPYDFYDSTAGTYVSGWSATVGNPSDGSGLRQFNVYAICANVS